MLTSDQGAIVTVNGGQTWSSWYNQPTAQLYHVNADNAFPYRLCSGQQESGSVCIASRGNDGEITFRDWHPVAAEEYGYVVPDPLDPDTVVGGKLTRYDRRTTQGQNIMPVAGGFTRFSRDSDPADRLFAARSAPALLCREHAMDHARPRSRVGSRSVLTSREKPGTYRQRSASSAPSRRRSPGSAA